MQRETKETLMAVLTLLTSTSTLLCCTIPILLISLGFGASLSLVLTKHEWWIKISEYKFLTFLISGTFLVFTYAVLRASGQYCPTDPILAERCKKIRVWNWRIFWLSITIWVVGFVSAYLLA